MANDTSIGHLQNDLLDNLLTWGSLGLGLPGNLLIFLAFWSYPPGPARLLYRLLAVFDTISLVLLVSQRPLVWTGLLTIEARDTSIFIKSYLNIIYYTCIFTNNISVFVILERLLHSRSQTAHAQYFQNLDRVKLTLLILGLLMVSFCLIITIKMSYYGLAWVVVFLFFYTVWPSVSILACIFLLISHYIKKYNEKKILDQNKPLTGSRLSFGEKSYSHHSGLSASGPFKGSTSSAHGFKGRKRDPYSIYLYANKSASESHLCVKPELSKSLSVGGGDGGCGGATGGVSVVDGVGCATGSGDGGVDTVVSLKIPSLHSLAGGQSRTAKDKQHDHLLKTQHNTPDGEEAAGGGEEGEHAAVGRTKRRNRQLTLMAVFGSLVVLLSLLPLSACASILMNSSSGSNSEEEGEGEGEVESFDLSDRYTYLVLTITHLSMYFTNASKFYTYCALSSIFRRHVRAVFTCTQRSLAEEEAHHHHSAHQ